jgi:hypothetical protein
MKVMWQIGRIYGHPKEEIKQENNAQRANSNSGCPALFLKDLANNY